MGFQIGQQVGPYVIQQFLAEGGMGVVWRVWNSRNSRPVAMKVVADEYVDASNYAQRFRDEVSRQSRLTHPNIVPVTDVFRFGNSRCMVMELIEGISLEALLKKSPDHRLEVSLATRIMSEVLSALNYAHMRGIWHRDVKPSNILLDQRNHAHLADFGIALAVGEERLTRAGVSVGTPLYMSPEQIQTPLLIDYRTDVYSAGCMFYEMLTGRPPFTAASDRPDAEYAIKSMHLKQPPVPPIDIVRTIPRHLNALILAALQKDRERRIPGCGEFLRRLKLVDSEAPSWPSSLRQRAFWIGAVIVITAIAMIAVGLA